jgi:hypothetical protein
MWPYYRRLRISRTARDLAEKIPASPGWSFERIRASVEEVYVQCDGSPNDASTSLPYLPKLPPADPRMSEQGQDGSLVDQNGWGWGMTMAVGIADAVAEILRAAVQVAPHKQRDRLAEARTRVTTARARIIAKKTASEEWQAAAGMEPVPAYWEKRLQVYQQDMVGPGAGTSGQMVADNVFEIVSELGAVASVVFGEIGGESRSNTDLDAWRMLFEDQPSSRALLARLLAVEVATTALADERPKGSALPINLAQLSLQTDHNFAEASRTPDDKAPGMALHRFSGFLKRSWRINDWIWGRLDAAAVLSSVVLYPARLRRVAVLANLTSAEEDTRKVNADKMVDFLCEGLFGEEQLPPDFKELKKCARDELLDVLDPQVAIGTLPSGLPALIDLCVWAVQLQIILEEMPSLVGAIRAGGVEGANRRSRGEVFLADNKELINTLETVRPTAEEWLPRGKLALRAFDRAGIGREPLAEEVSSDQFIRTATTAAAVAATVLDSNRSGLGVIKPVTRAVRGATLLPYWVAIGLTRGGNAARYLTLFGLSVGGLLLVLSLFGLLPTVVAGPAAVIWVGALLAAFGYGALRSGTLLHGLVLLSPIIPLVTFAAHKATSAAPTPDGAAPPQSDSIGIATFLAAVAVVLGLIILASLPTPVRSPTCTMRALLDRQATRYSLDPTADPTARERWLAAARLVTRLLAVVGMVSLAVLVISWGHANWAGLRDALPAIRTMVIVLELLNILLVAVGIALAARVSHTLAQRHPAVATAHWSVVYGAGYSVAPWLAWWLLALDACVNDVLNSDTAGDTKPEPHSGPELPFHVAERGARRKPEIIRVNADARICDVQQVSRPGGKGRNSRTAPDLAR